VVTHAGTKSQHVIEMQGGNPFGIQGPGVCFVFKIAKHAQLEYADTP